MKTRVPSMPSTDLRAVARIHYEEMAAYLMNHPAKEPANMRPPTQRELARLTTQQFQELSTDVYDELIRKNNNSENELPSLPVRGEFHPKRNEARQKLATHPRFKDFCNYVFEELRRRVPDLKEVGVRFPITTAHHISSIQNNRKIEDSGDSSGQDTTDDFHMDHSVKFTHRPRVNTEPDRINATPQALLPRGGIGLYFRGIDLQSLFDDDIQVILCQVVDILSDREQKKAFFESCSADPVPALNVLQALLDRGNLSPSHQSRLLRALARLCKLYACFPDSLILSGVQRTRMDPSAGGGFADIWRGQLSTRCIAIKALRIFEQSDREKALKDFSHEAIIWRQLKHPNILPFYGVFKGDENFERLCLISPWMDAGNINDYLKKYPESNRLALIADALNGLSYLHSFQPSIIHGDLKGANIFVTHSRTACLGDFGLSRFRDSHESTLGATSGHSTGTLRWQAPELFVNVDGRTARPSAESDVYSIGCVCLELMTGKPPFSEFSRDGAVLTAVLNKKCPQRPSEDLVHRGLNDSLWSLMKKCWHFDRDQRPKVGTLLQFFVERKWSTGPHLLRRGDLSANVSLNMTSSPVEILDVGMTGNVAVTSRPFLLQAPESDQLPISSNGGLLDIHVDAFLSAIDVLLNASRGNSPPHVLTPMIAVHNAATALIEDTRAYERRPPHLMTGVDPVFLRSMNERAQDALGDFVNKTYATSFGRSPVSLLHVAANHLAATVTEVGKTIGVRKATRRERDEFATAPKSGLTVPSSSPTTITGSSPEKLVSSPQRSLRRNAGVKSVVKAN